MSNVIYFYLNDFAMNSFIGVIISINIIITYKNIFKKKKNCSSFLCWILLPVLLDIS